MKRTSPFLLTLSAWAVAGAAVVLTAPATPNAAAADSLPRSTALTPVMIENFGLDEAFVRPSIAALLQCHAKLECGSSDSSQERFVDASGALLAVYDGAPRSAIGTVRRQQATLSPGITESRTLVWRYSKDAQGRVVMNGADSIVKIDTGAADRVPSTLTRGHRYNDVRYLAPRWTPKSGH